jgi:hypothetical protein
LWRAYTTWVRRLPQATVFIFAARSRWGRSFKIFLFGVGIFLPLGSLIWVLLFWHGNGVLRHGVAWQLNKPAVVRHASELPAPVE